MNIYSYFRAFSHSIQQKYNVRTRHEYDILVRGSKCVRGMIPMNLVAQAIGMAGMLLVFISYQMNDRRRMLNYQIAISLIWVVHFYLLGAYAAAGINLICVGRDRWIFWPSPARPCRPLGYGCGSLEKFDGS